MATKTRSDPPTPRSPPPVEVVEAISAKAAAKGKASKTNPLSFQAELWSPMEGKGWTFATLPAASSAALGARGRVPVEATVGGVAFRTSCFPNGKGGHSIQLNAAMRSAAQAEAGDTVAFTLKLASDDVALDPPAELVSLLESDAKAGAQWDAITPKARAEWVAWIASAKREETRVARVAKTAQRLARGAKRPGD